MTTRIETERLTLCPLERGDAPFLVRLMNEPSWLAYIGDRGMRCVEDAELYLESKLIPLYDRPWTGMLRVQRREDGGPIGICGLLDRPGVGEVDLGFALLATFERQGYAREAAAAMIAVARDQLGLKRLAAFVADGNARSQHLLRTLGFRREAAITLGAAKVPVQHWRLPLRSDETR